MERIRYLLSTNLVSVASKKWFSVSVFFHNFLSGISNSSLYKRKTRKFPTPDACKGMPDRPVSSTDILECSTKKTFQKNALGPPHGHFSGSMIPSELILDPVARKCSRRAGHSVHNLFTI